MADSAFYAFIAFLVIFDPPGTAAIFAAISAGRAAAERRAIALRASAIALIVLVAFALGGGELLRALGISLPALKVGGGLLLFLLSADMVMGRTMLRASPEEQAAASRTPADITVFPLAIPLLAGPGAMTTAVLLAEQAGADWARRGLVLAAMAAALALTLFAMLAAARVSALLGETGQHVIGRVLGVVLAALAAEIVLSGLRESLG
jgi:multiple antibiotic resistance protein